MKNNLNETSMYLTNIEHQVTKQEVYYVDISKIFNEQNTIIEIYNKADNFKKFTELIEKIEQIDERKLTTKSVNVQSPITQTKSPNINLSQSSNTNKTVFKQVKYPINPQSNIKINQTNLAIKQKLYPIPINTEIKTIEKELEKTLGKKSQEFLQTNTSIKNKILNNKKQDIEPNNSVLVKLSIQDQISELEKIIKGLNLNHFNKQQIGIIEEEADSLNFYINNNKKINNIDSNLVNLRKARLNLVRSLLYN